MTSIQENPNNITHDKKILSRTCLAVWVISMIVVVFLSLTPRMTAPLPFRSADKIYHSLAYLWLALLSFGALNSRRNKVTGGLLMLVLGGIIELIQNQVPGRYGCFSDMLANGTGVGLGVGIGLVLNGRLKHLFRLRRQ